VTAAGVIDLRRRLAARLGNEQGQGLIELLIAVLVLNIGIFATIGAFTSAGTTIRRASRISTATAIADQYMQCFRNASYANIVWPMTTGNCTATSVTGPDGRTYTVSATISTGAGVTVTNGSSNLKLVSVTVTDTSGVIATTTSTFSRCSLSGLGTDTGKTPCYS
jgi:type II secretory pathway pseudopilin PulG